VIFIFTNRGSIIISSLKTICCPAAIMSGFKSPESLYEFPSAITHSTPSVSGIQALNELGRSFTPSSDFSDDSAVISRPVQKPYTTHGSAIWNYFRKEVDEDGDGSKCCVVLDNGEICNQKKVFFNSMCL
jgi:hypothetical protein